MKLFPQNSKEQIYNIIWQELYSGDYNIDHIRIIPDNTVFSMKGKSMSRTALGAEKAIFLSAMHMKNSTMRN